MLLSLLVAGLSDQAAAPAKVAVERLLACRDLTATGERLACFDREAATVAAAMASDRIRVTDADALRHEQRARFGLPPGPDAQPDGRLTHFASTLAGSAAVADGRLLLTLADGSRWRQVDDYPLAHTPHPGDPVTIDLTALGSYKLRVGKEAPIRVRRADAP